MPVPDKALLLVNRKARGGGQGLDAAVARLEACGYQIIRPNIDDPGEMPHYVREHGHEVALVIVCGGDGSLNAVADELVALDLPLGVLPQGTANDLARTLGIPQELYAASELICSGVRYRIDMGWVNGKHFFNTASIGLGTEVAKQLDRQVKTRWGVLGYLRALWSAYRLHRTFKAHIVVDGRDKQIRAIQIGVGNGRHYGGGMTVHERARLDDQLLHLYAIRAQSWWRLLRLVPALRQGRYPRDQDVYASLGRQIQVHPARRQRINVDGELLSWTPARFRVVPKALSVYISQELAEQGEAQRVQR